MTRLLIGLGGYAESGKDTAADLLQRTRNVPKTWMSRPLDEMLTAIDPLIPLYHDSTQRAMVRYSVLRSNLSYEDAKKNDEVRTLLQKLGTEAGRKILGEHVWIDLAMEHAEQLAEERRSPAVTITGMRYPNELEGVRASGGILVWINRPGYGPVNAHTSDNSVTPADSDVVLQNDGDLAQLSETVTAWYDSVVSDI